MTSDVADLTSTWQARLEPAVCEHCDRRFLLPAGFPAQRCPGCFRRELTPLDPESDLDPFPHPPELVVPYAVSEELLRHRVAHLARQIPFAPPDLQGETLYGRLRRVYVPRWLVDANVQAQLQAEVGFDYEVVSHREQYVNGDWRTQEVRETRVRWEPRLGRLERSYGNIPAPALEGEATLFRRLGDFKWEKAEAYEPAVLDQSFVQLPDRRPEDAWSDAELVFREAAADECRRAAEAQHIRDFQWTASYSDQYWTQLLCPLYTTYYLDDEGVARPVLIHGQSGQLYGERRASPRRALRIALMIGGVGLVLLVLALVLGLVAAFADLPLGPFAALAAFIGLGLFLAALFPPLRVWQFNRQAALS